MSEMLEGVPECVEHNRGEVLEARTEAISRFTGLGPVDLCHVTKVFTPSLGTLLKGEQRKGSYHHLVGLDTSSAAAVCAYIGELSQRQSPSTWLSGGEWSIVGGCFCCFDAFSRVDLRVDVRIPGGVTTYVVDRHGSRSPANATHWRHASVCGVLRSLCRPPEQQGLLLMVPSLAPEQEASFLQEVKAVIEEGGRLDDEDELSSEPLMPPEGGSEAPPNLLRPTLIDHVLWRYFEQSLRYEQAADFFASILPCRPVAAVFVARARRATGAPERALTELSASVLNRPDAVPLLLEHADIALELGRSSEALALVSAAVRLEPAELTCWLLLARAYSANDSPELALVALNAAPVHLPPPRSPTTTDLLPSAYMPVSDHMTNGEDVVPVPAVGQGAERWGRPEPDEAEALESLGDVTTPPVAPIGVLRHLEDGLIAAAETLSPTERSVYDVLVSMVSIFGWARLGEARRNVFAVPGDELPAEPSAAATATATDEGPGRAQVMPAAMAAAPASATEAEVTEEVRPGAAPPMLPARERLARANSGLPGGKRICRTWLDNLFRTLLADLQALSDWETEARAPALRPAPIEEEPLLTVPPPAPRRSPRTDGGCSASGL